MSKKSKRARSRQKIRGSIAQIYPHASIVMDEVAAAYPDRPREDLIDWVRNLTVVDRIRLIHEVVDRRARRERGEPMPENVLL